MGADNEFHPTCTDGAWHRGCRRGNFAPEGQIGTHHAPGWVETLAITVR
jgi:hypothetical protein